MGTTENMQQSLLDTVALLTQHSIDNSTYPITIKCQVIDVKDPGLNIYNIKYGENTLEAYASKDYVYSNNDVVYVLVPNGDFEQKKLILGAVNPSATMYATENDADTYVSISDNLFGSIEDVDLKSWEDEIRDITLDISSFGSIFSDYLNTYRNIAFKASVKTEIDKAHQVQGNYGLKLYLPFLEAAAGGVFTETWRTFNLDVNTMHGTPYSFNEYAPQNIYFEIDDSLIYDTERNPKLEAFVDGFGYDDTWTPAADFDIHFKDISVEIVDVLNEKDKEGYYLACVAKGGNYFLEGKYVSTKTLVPELRIKGKKSDHTKWECYWFVEDASIKTSSDRYLKIGGLGWKCLNKKTNISYDSEGKQSYQYVTNNFTYEVRDTDVPASLRYKCVLVQDEIIVGGSVKLKNLNNKIKIDLVSATGSNSFVEGIGNVVLQGRIYYPGVTDNLTSNTTLVTKWQRFDKNGEYLDDDFYVEPIVESTIEITNAVGDKEKWRQFEISYPCSKLEKLNLVNCTFYGTTIINGDVVQNNLGTASISVTTSSDFTYRVAIQNGDVLYKYDSDGNSPLVATYDGPLSSKVKSINPLSFNIFKTDGSELTEVEYAQAKFKWSFPKNSMLKLVGYSTEQLKELEQDDEYYYIIGYGKDSLIYNISDTYSKKKNDNAILVSVTFDNLTFSDVTSFKFIKEGEGGTNGTKYSVFITYQSYGYGELNSNKVPVKLLPVYVNGVGWKRYDPFYRNIVDFGSPALNVTVYADGNQINSGYSIVSWTMFDQFSLDSKPVFTMDNNILTVASDWSDVTKNSSNIIQVTVRITDQSVTNSQQTIEAYYPIDIVRLPNSNYLNKTCFNLEGGFEEVVFASDGTNPQYDSSEPFKIDIGSVAEDATDYFDYTWSLSGNLKFGITPGNAPTATIRPVAKFDNGISKNFVKVTLDTKESSSSDLANKITEIENEITRLNNRVLFVRHNKQTALDFYQKFNYNTIIRELSQTKGLLKLRFNCFNNLDKLYNILDELKNYCDNKDIRIEDFDYAVMVEELTQIINTSYENLYLLGYNKTLEDLTGMDGAVFVFDEELIKTRYGIAAAALIKGYQTQWNETINLFNSSYSSIVEKVNEEYIYNQQYLTYKNVVSLLFELKDDELLTYLASNHDDNSADQDYVNIKNQFSTILNKLTNSYFKITSYNSFLDNILYRVRDTFIPLRANSSKDYNLNKEIVQLESFLVEQEELLSKYKSLQLPDTNQVILIKPIVFVYNKYEMSNINGWDGNKLYVDPVNNEYVLAPQFGAGIKSSNNTFTGVIMGIKQFNNTSSGQQRIGLMGYNSGVQSFFLNAQDGSAILGQSGKGQILIDPSTGEGRIYSGNFYINVNQDGKPTSYASSNEAKQGMLINLTKPEIRWGNGYFYIDANGHMHAGGGGEDTGNGDIGGWYITNSYLYSGNKRLYIDSSVPRIYGQTGSTKHDSLISTTEGFYIGPDGASFGNSIRISAADGGAIYVGRVNGSRKWTINGNTNESYIGYNADDGFNAGNLWDYNTYWINGNWQSVFLGTEGIRLGRNFAIDRDGNMVARSGIFTGHIRGGSININGNFLVDTDGNVTTNGNITMKGSIDVQHFIALGYGHNSTIWDNGALFYDSVNIKNNFVCIAPAHDHPGSAGWGITVGNGSGWSTNIGNCAVYLYSPNKSGSCGEWTENALKVFGGSAGGNVEAGYDVHAAHHVVGAAVFGNGGGYALCASNSGGSVDHNWTVGGDIYARNLKSRIAKTKNYNDRLLYCFEATSPMFADFGEGELDETGICYVFVDDIFAETVALDVNYQVMLQKYGEGDCWVEDRTYSYFIVKGTPGLKFGWSLNCVQEGFKSMRTEEFDDNNPINEINPFGELETALSDVEDNSDPFINIFTYLDELAKEEK